MSEPKKYILLPMSGFLSQDLKLLAGSDTSQSSHGKVSTQALNRMPSIPGIEDLEVVDSVTENGPKAVTLPPETARTFMKSQSIYTLAPIRKYRPAVRPFATVHAKNLYAKSSERVSIKVSVHDANNDVPLKEVYIVAVLDALSMRGLTRRTGKRGQATLTFPGKSRHVAKLYVYPPNGYWGRYAENITFSDGEKILLEPINLAFPDIVQQIYPKRAGNQGRGVRVGVIDSGVDLKHPDLQVVGGMNLTEDGNGRADFGPVTDHGTHVAGIIAGRGSKGTGMVGLAPEVELYSYRVFQKGVRTTENFFIAKAIYQAVADGCHLINLSLGGGSSDVALSKAIGYAFEHGVLCIAAVGNDRRQAVAYPAWHKRAIAVSALGKTGTFPADSLDVSEIQEPFSKTDRTLFLAGFSNIGYEVDFISPGVGVVSTTPNQEYAVMSGTSMACPAVTGVAAALLSDDQNVLKASPNMQRTLAIIDILQKAVLTQGFAHIHEGLGCPQMKE
jgi:subtilisin